MITVEFSKAEIVLKKNAETGNRFFQKIGQGSDQELQLKYRGLRGIM
jgi:hypothetical protein